MLIHVCMQDLDEHGFLAVIMGSDAFLKELSPQ